MSVFSKLFLLLFSFGLLPILFTAAFVGFHIESLIVSSNNITFLKLADEVGNNVGRLVNEGYQSCRILSSSFTGMEDLSFRGDIDRELQKNVMFYPIFKDITLLSLEGDIISSVQYSFRGDWRETKWFQRAQDGFETLSDAHFVLYPYDVIITASFPVYDLNGNIWSVLIGELSLDYIIDIVTKFKIGESGETIVVNDHGMLVVSADKEKLLENVELPIDVYLSDNKVSGVNSKDEQVVVYKNIEITAANEFHWILISTLPKKIAYPAIYEVRWAILMIMGLSFLFVVLVSLILSRKIGNRIGRILEAYSLIAEGDFSQPLVDNHNDEFSELVSVYNFTRKELSENQEKLIKYQYQLENEVEKRTKELKKTHDKLVDAAHMAGMAEVAVGVLHNIGNTATAMYSTASRIENDVSDVDKRSLLDLVGLMQDKQNDLSAFLTKDERGRNIIPFLRHHVEEHDKRIKCIQNDMKSLIVNLDHVNEVLLLQQAHVKNDPGILDTRKISTIIDDSLTMLRTFMAKRKIVITQEYEYNEPVLVNRTSLIQIFVNILKNAAESLNNIDEGARKITIRINLHDSKNVANNGGTDKLIEVTIADNGCGFDSETAGKLFSYGFTTKNKIGGGYGLHYCANYLQSIGGRLQAKSKGIGTGAAMTIYYPFKPKIELKQNNKTED